MFVTDTARGTQLPFQVLHHAIFRLSFRPQDDVHSTLLEDADGPFAHSTRQYRVCSMIGEKIGQETRLVPWIRHRFPLHDLPLFAIEEDELLTMAKVSCDTHVLP